MPPFQVDDSDLSDIDLQVNSVEPVSAKSLAEEIKQMQQTQQVQLSADEKHEQLKQLYSKTFINFPINSGMSGIVFQSGKVAWSN
jgi:hypothetical protein